MMSWPRIQRTITIGKLRLGRACIRLVEIGAILLSVLGYGGALLCFFGLFALQFYLFLRHGEAPSYSWNSLVGPVIIEGWAGLNKILFFAGKIHIAFVVYYFLALFGLLGFVLQRSMEDEYAAVTKKLRSAEQPSTAVSQIQPSEKVSGLFSEK